MNSRPMTARPTAPTHDRWGRVKRVIEDHPDWSLPKVAEWTGVSYKTVERVMESLHLSNGQVKPSQRTGRDGRTINTANIGQSRADDDTPTRMPAPQRHPRDG